MDLTLVENLYHNKNKVNLDEMTRDHFLQQCESRYHYIFSLSISCSMQWIVRETSDLQGSRYVSQPTVHPKTLFPLLPKVHTDKDPVNHFHSLSAPVFPLPAKWFLFKLNCSCFTQGKILPKDCLTSMQQSCVLFQYDRILLSFCKAFTWHIWRV